MSGATRTAKKGRPVLTLFLLLVLLGSSGVVIQRFVAPPTTFLMVSRALGGEGLDYRWRSLDDISPRLVQAAIAAEDARFCAHSGFDIEAIEKALKANARSRSAAGPHPRRLDHQPADRQERLPLAGPRLGPQGAGGRLHRR